MQHRGNGTHRKTAYLSIMYLMLSYMLWSVRPLYGCMWKATCAWTHENTDVTEKQHLNPQKPGKEVKKVKVFILVSYELPEKRKDWVSSTCNHVSQLQSPCTLSADTTSWTCVCDCLITKLLNAMATLSAVLVWNIVTVAVLWLMNHERCALNSNK